MLTNLVEVVVKKQSVIVYVAHLGDLFRKVHKNTFQLCFFHWFVHFANFYIFMF